MFSTLYFAHQSRINTIKYNKTSKLIVDKLNIVDNLKLKLDTLLHEMNFKSFGDTEQAKPNSLNQESQKYLDENNLVYNFKDIHNLLLACKQQHECVDARRKYGTDKIFMLLPKKLFTEMSEINMLAFGTKSCTKLEFFITEDGVLDNKKLLEENTCLLKISGFKA